MSRNRGPTRKENTTDIFVIAIWLGVLSGLPEAFVLSIFWMIPEWLTWQIRLRNASAEIFWIAPAFDVLLYCGVAALLLVLVKAKERVGFHARLLNHMNGTRLALLLFTWMGLYAALTVPGRLTKKAAFVLALGVALQVVRWLRPRQDALKSWLRPRAPFAAALVVLLALLIKGGTGLQEQLAAARLSPAGPGLPNVLLVVADTLRADHLSCYGYRRPTSPTIDRVAREGVLFENAFASSSWSPPSHASLFLGRRVSEHMVDGMEPALGATYPSLAEEMASSGYLTGGFSANLLWVTTRSGFARGFIHYEDYFTNVFDMVNRTVLGKELVNRVISTTGYRNLPGRKSARSINRSLLRWLDNHGKRPFFAFLNYFDVHAPYISPAPFHTRFMTAEQRDGARDYDFDPDVGGPPKKELAEAAYDGGIAYLDAQLDDLLKELDVRGLLDDTILIFTSDHGESFGEKHQFGHGHSLSLELIHVPLIIRYPSAIPAGVRVAPPVTTRTLAATIGDLTAGEPVQSVFPTPSLRSYWSKSKAAVRKPRYVVSELKGQPWRPLSEPVSRGSLTSIILPSFQILFQNRRTQIYGLKTGRLENFSNSKEDRKLLKSLPSIKAWRRQHVLF